MKDEYAAVVEYWQGKTKVPRVQPLQCKSKQDWLGIEPELHSDRLVSNHHSCRTADYSYQIVAIWLLGSKVIFMYNQHVIIVPLFVHHNWERCIKGGSKLKHYNCLWKLCVTVQLIIYCLKISCSIWKESCLLKFLVAFCHSSNPLHLDSCSNPFHLDSCSKTKQHYYNLEKLLLTVCSTFPKVHFYHAFNDVAFKRNLDI